MNNKYDLFNNDFFKQNRRRFARELKPNSVAIFRANDVMPRSGDLMFKFCQNADFFYLTGIDQEDCILMIYPDCVKDKFREVLFVKQTNDHIQVWEGYKYNKEDARKVSGIENVIWLDDMAAPYNELILLADNIYLNNNENDRYVSDIAYNDLRLAHELRYKYPNHNYFRSAPIMKKLRMIKSQHEITAIQQACDITEKAFRRVLGFTKPGVTEYEIEAEIIHEFIRNRANGHAYDPIIASGASACILHYNANNLVCKAGDVILMDFGCEYGNYASDLTRCIPVSGKFTDRQRNVYNAVLNVMKEATQMLVPGTTLVEYNAEVGKIMESELIGLGLIDKTDVKNQDPENPLYKKYFMHGTSHHMGLDVHDLMNRYDPMRAGMVFTCEPGIYIPEEGLGIRLENDILVTDHAPIDLMANIPLEAAHIEDLMNVTVGV
jgi:Xaa-Pro aminopeptidase